MAGVLLNILPLAFAAAISPAPIITSITLTGTRRPTVSLLAYLLGGLLAYLVVGAIGTALINTSNLLASNGQPSRLALIIELVIGAGLMAFALFSLVVPPRTEVTPRWMTAIEGFGPRRAFLAGTVILGPRLKNLLLLAAALDVVGAAGLGLLSGIIVILLFVGITLSPVLAPLLVHLRQPPERAAATTGVWKSWLERNNRIILGIVFGVMGLKLAVDGLTGLLT